MAWREISPWDWQTRPMALLAKEKMLFTAEDGERCNSMTVGWGGFGVMWGCPVAYYAIRPTRYTFGLAEEGSAVSLAAFPAAFASALSYLGTHSGREGEKYSAAGITPIRMPHGGIGFSEASLVLTGRKLFSHAMCPEELAEGAIAKRWYGEEPYHTLYIAEIEHIYLAE